MSKEGSLTNHLLVAMPGLDDPNFAQTVTLICEHSSRGALGIVLNKPLSMRLTEVLAQMKLPPETRRYRLTRNRRGHCGGEGAASGASFQPLPDCEDNHGCGARPVHLQSLRRRLRDVAEARVLHRIAANPSNLDVTSLGLPVEAFEKFPNTDLFTASRDGTRHIGRCTSADAHWSTAGSRGAKEGEVPCVSLPGR